MHPPAVIHTNNKSWSISILFKKISYKHSLKRKSNGSFQMLLKLTRHSFLFLGQSGKLWPELTLVKFFYNHYFANAYPIWRHCYSAKSVMCHIVKNSKMMLHTFLIFQFTKSTTSGPEVFRINYLVTAELHIKQIVCLQKTIYYISFSKYWPKSLICGMCNHQLSLSP